MFWKWLEEKHPRINAMVWLLILAMSLCSLGISVFGQFIK